jgi:flagellin-like hook-associated protein FlgL
VAVTIGSNIASLGAQRQLAKNSERLSSVFERLSSGQRINRAADDAAGLAIADSLRSNARVQAVAVRNINDGVSASNILSSALTSQSEILTRLSELSEQSANGTFDNNQRKAISTEFKALVDELARIGKTSTFNGVSLLDSTSSKFLSTLTLQAGTDSSANSQLNLLMSHGGANGGVISLNGLVDLFDASVGLFGQLGLSLSQIQSSFGNNFRETKVHDDAGNERTVLTIIGQYGGGISFLTLTRDLSEEGKSIADSTWGGEVDAAWIDAAVANSRSLNASTGKLSGGSLDLSNGGNVSGFTFNSAEQYLDISGLTISSSNGVGAPNLGASSNLEFTSVASQSAARNALDVVKNRLMRLAFKSEKLGHSKAVRVLLFQIYKLVAKIILLLKNESEGQTLLLKLQVLFKPRFCSRRLRQYLLKQTR